MNGALNTFLCKKLVNEPDTPTFITLFLEISAGTLVKI